MKGNDIMKTDAEVIATLNDKIQKSKNHVFHLIAKIHKYQNEITACLQKCDNRKNEITRLEKENYENNSHLDV